MRWLDSIWLSGHKFEQTLGDSEGWGSLACLCSWGPKELETTQRLNSNSYRFHLSHFPDWHETGLGSRYRICICALASTNVSVYLLYTLVYPSKGEFFWVLKSNVEGTFLVVQWLGLCAFIAGGMSSIPGRVTGILHTAAWQKKFF